MLGKWLIKDRFWLSWNNLFTGIVVVYGLGLGVWALLRWRWPDRWWWLFLVNSFAVYLLLPLPLILVLSWLSGQTIAWLAAGVALAVAAYLLGPSILPIWLRRRPILPNKPILQVLTWNVLNKNLKHTAIAATLQQANADLICLQELTCAAADDLSTSLAHTYPHRLLAAQPDDSGMGIFSRYPLTPIPHDMAGVWIGPPQVAQFTFNGQPITLINAHPISTPPTNPLHMYVTMKQRVDEVQTLMAFVAQQTTPVIMVGDFNAAQHSHAYDQVRAKLCDAWVEAGVGLGHTFPGKNPIDNGQPNAAERWTPKWLTRIDFIFHSRHFVTQRATIGLWDEGSDHRPVCAELALN